MNLQEKIDSFSMWYQCIDFGGGIVTPGHSDCGEPFWEIVKELLPDSLEEMRVLDLGSNAGLYCVKAALMGAKEVIGVEEGLTGLQAEFMEQAELVKSYFEKKHNTTLPIKFIVSRIEPYLLALEDPGWFDLILAFAVLYRVNDKDHYAVIERLSQITNTVIGRCRSQTERRDYFDDIFRKVGFDVSHLPENREISLYVK